MLEKFGIISNERKREITELKKISDIAQEDNRLRDYEYFYNNHQNFKLEKDQSTEFPLEVVLNRAKREKDSYELVIHNVGEVPNDYKIKNLFYTAEQSFNLIDFGDNATKIKDASELKKFAKSIIDDIYKESKYIHSMNYDDLKFALNFLKNKDSQLKNILYSEEDTLEFLETVIENQIKKLEQEIKKNEKNSKEKAKPKRNYDDNYVDLINNEMPKSVSNYYIHTDDFFNFKEVSYNSTDITFSQTSGHSFNTSLGIFGEERIPTSLESARIKFDNDAFYETTKNPEERKLVENITMANLINLKQELNKKENNYFENLPEYVTSSIRPKLAFKLLEFFPGAEITLVNKSAKGRNAAKLLEIASKSGEKVLMKFKSEDLKNNKKLDSKKEDVIEYIKSMEK